MSRPNILIILADDLGVDSFRIDKINKQVVACVEGLGDSAGPVHLPTFERMLANGVHFEKAWAHPVCTPTKTSAYSTDFVIPHINCNRIFIYFCRS